MGFLKSQGFLSDKDMTNPMTTAGDIIVGGASGVPSRLPVGVNGQVLTLSAGTPEWVATGAASDVEALRSAIAYLSLDNMLLTGAVVKQYDQQAQDIFVDETGVTTKTNMTYSAANNSYQPTPLITETLLIQSNTTDGSTEFTDLVKAKTITANGDAQHDTSLGATGDPFGGSLSNIQFDGTGDSLTIPDHADFDVNTGNWSFECWFRPTSVSGVRYIFSFPGSATYVGTTGTNLFFYANSGTYNSNTSGITLSINTWYHLAVVREGDNLRIFVNGINRLNQALSTSFNITDGSGDFKIGDVFSGHMQDIYYIKGTATRSGTTTFTPPTSLRSTTIPNITFVSDPFTATASPSQADVYALVSFTTGSVSDLSIGARREGSSSYESSAPTDTGFDFYDIDTAQTYDIVKVNDLDLSAQTSGTAPQVQLTSSNNINFTFKGWLMQWL